jgi:CheY-like chemotaxis protein
VIAERKQAHILVVEDDQDIRESIVEVLEEGGYTVSVAGDGLEALESLQHARPDLILLDLMMPNMNGFQFREAQLSNADHAKIPVAIVTADANVKEKAEQLRAVGFARKPLKIQPLLDLVSRALGR